MYQALYRKWRPRTFADVSGQDTVTTALRNEIMNDRLSHAYLFTGCRGTGKTTCAKILAKAVNCEHPVDGNPCNECAVCRGIDDGSVLDVTEIDAASNNGVDSIRDLREEVAFTPVAGRYRVYIIDEVHMLSAGAFNALLKTLEEPPAHVIFILATTEVHKLPATILSRCQRFDFGRIRPETIAARLCYVAEQEGLTLTPDAAALLARLADGAMRDALSLLDQCASGVTHIDAETVSACTGMAGQASLAALTDCVVRRDGAAALAEVDALYRSSKDMERLCAEWITYLRNLMVLHSTASPEELIVAAPEDIAAMREMTARMPLASVLHCMEVLQATLDRLRGGVSRRVEMEMTVLRLCDPRLEDDLTAIARRVGELEAKLERGVTIPAPTDTHPDEMRENGVGDGALDIPPQATHTPSVAPVGDDEMRENGQRPFSGSDGSAFDKHKPSVAPVGDGALDVPPQATDIPSQATDVPPQAIPTPAEETPFSGWAEVLAHLQSTCIPLFAVLEDSTALEREDTLIICTENAMFKELLKMGDNKQLLMDAIVAVTGTRPRITLRRRTVVAEHDPLADLLAASRTVGVDITEK